jgi:antitoxin (DNA-binding transcriptional repressor) of toxin-antitoxin stability system
MMGVNPVSVRDFRAHLAEHIDSSAPVAVTRHGQTVGFFIPVKTDLAAEKAAFRQAAARFNALLGEGEAEQILQELDELRHQKIS